MEITKTGRCKDVGFPKTGIQKAIPNSRPRKADMTQVTTNSEVTSGPDIHLALSLDGTRKSYYEH
jgi:hypothetical protein